MALAPEDDFVVLASDGLWDKVTNSEAVTAARRSLARERTAAAAARTLVERAMRCASTDNVTVLVVKLHERAIALPKTNSMLFRKQQSLSAVGCGSEGGSGPPSRAGSATPSSCASPALLATPRGDAPLPPPAPHGPSLLSQSSSMLSRG